MTDTRSGLDRASTGGAVPSARVLVVHGISQHLCGPWRSAMRSGLLKAGYSEPRRISASCVIYSDLMPGHYRSDVHEWEPDTPFTADGHPPRRSERTRTRLARGAVGLLDHLPASWSDRLIIGFGGRYVNRDLGQIRHYFADPATRAAVHERLAESITADSSVLVGHSFGSVVAYEALCAHPEWPVRTLVTLGSPLGIEKLVFSRLNPPAMGGLGQWPGSVDHWVNLSDPNDATCVVPRLAPLFGFRVEDHTVDNGADPHGLSHYLASTAAGRAIAGALGRGEPAVEHRRTERPSSHRRDDLDLDRVGAVP